MSELFTEQRRDAGFDGVAPRRIAMCVFAAVVIVALLNLIGQEPTTSGAAGAPASLELSAPEAVRGGLLVQGRIRITAHATVTDPRLVLARGWFEGMQVNTIEPAATDEAPGEGESVVLTYGRLEPGDRMTVWIQLQVDPNSPGRRPLDVALRDGGRPIAAVRRDITVLP
jgi:hypothetical protein